MRNTPLYLNIFIHLSLILFLKTCSTNASKYSGILIITEHYFPYDTLNLILFHQVGTYSNGSHCIPCDIGHYCPSPLNAPQPCPPGSYANETGSVSCKACDAGHSCLDPSNTPVPCAAGEYSISGQTSCTVSKPNNTAEWRLQGAFS